MLKIVKYNSTFGVRNDFEGVWYVRVWYVPDAYCYYLATSDSCHHDCHLQIIYRSWQVV